MNTMDYEQKYKEALGWMKSLYGGLHGKTKEEAEKYFPELQESDDERIRKAIITFFESEDDNTTYALVPKKDILAWLEKQGKKKSQRMVSAEAKEALYDKPKWTDEDEERLQSCIIALQGKGLMGGVDTMDSKWLKSLKQRIHDNSAKSCKNDTLYDLLHKMPSCITVDGIDYYFVMKKTSVYTAYYKALQIDSPILPIFWMTSFSPIDLLTEMLEHMKKKGLLE